MYIISEKIKSIKKGQKGYSYLFDLSERICGKMLCRCSPMCLFQIVYLLMFYLISFVKMAILENDNDVCGRTVKHLSINDFLSNICRFMLYFNVIFKMTISRATNGLKVAFAHSAPYSQPFVTAPMVTM